ncbi:MAG TPA: DNA-directed RNA polymerase subunit omega [Acidimicrobiales bacterium]|nr:DNA-directed RNA polymerase subunit omega [Acidimicrobiales bacterium]
MAQHKSTLMDPPVEDLLDKVDSKFTLVALASRRARQVNSYYNSLGEGIGVVVPPQVASVSGKPLSIAFEEVAAGKATFTRPDPDEEAALAEAAALAALEDAEEADIEAAGLTVEVAAEVAAEVETEAAVEASAEAAVETETEAATEAAADTSGDAPAE